MFISSKIQFLKANHNTFKLNLALIIVVYQFKDTIFWKQITTVPFVFVMCVLLFISSKIQFSESKSQLFWLLSAKTNGCLSVQRYNFLKANHNLFISEVWFPKLFISSKIQFSESKSQLYNIIQKSYQCCLSVQRYNFLKANHNSPPFRYIALQVVYQFKDTIFWKQITTKYWNRAMQKRLFISSKIQFSESKSQLFR